jgi:hypothetical protein
MSEGTDLIDAQLAAYRDRDLGRYVTFFSDDVVIRDAEGHVLVEGIEALRAFYENMFRDSDSLEVRIPSRIEVGSFVIDEEHITGLVSEGLPPSLEAACVYRVHDGKIRAMTFVM